MTGKKSWYSKTSFSFFVFCSFCFIHLIFCRNLKLGNSTDRRYTVYSITFEYYGVDASRIESLITMPLEEKILGMNGLVDCRSLIEYGKTTTTVYFDKCIDQTTSYLALRNCVDTLYLTLPSDVQKPRLYSSAAQDKAIICFTFEDADDDQTFCNYIDTQLKHQLETVDGVSEVIITGKDIDEIAVAFDVDKVVGMGQNPEALGSIIRDGNAVGKSAVSENDMIKEGISFDTKLHSLDEIKNLPVKIDKGYTTLRYLADISLKKRQSEEIVRINGNKCIAINIKSSSNGNAISISKRCRNILSNSEICSKRFKVLYDMGEDLQTIISSMTTALVQSFLCVLLLIPFFFSSTWLFSLIIAMMGCTCFLSVGQLSLLGLTIDQNTIAGMSIALGLIVDPVLIIGEIAERSFTFDLFIGEVKNNYISIISAAVTTIIVLIPLFFFDFIVPGIKSIAVTIMLMIGNSILLSLVFLPCFIYLPIHNRAFFSKRIVGTVEKKYTRMCYRLTSFSIRNKRMTSLLYVVLGVLPFVFFFASGKNLTLDSHSNIVSATVEFESERSAESIDSELQSFISTLTQNKSITYVQSECRKGAADLQICFDSHSALHSALQSEIAQYVYSLADMIPDGYLFVPGIQSRSHSNYNSIEIAVQGDDEKKCREYAKEASAAISKSQYADSVVLNFKRPEKEYVFTPDKSLLTQNDSSISTTANSLRYILFGPVVDKWLENGTEKDVRVKGNFFEHAGITELHTIYLPTKQSHVHLYSLGKFEMQEGTGKIYRKDGRRAAYFTVETHGHSTDSVLSELHHTLNQITMDKGYCFSFPRELTLLQNRYTLLFASYILAVVFILILLIALTENSKKALLMISIISASSFLPLAIRFLTATPLELGDIIGMIVLSGISVNNSIYIIESQKSTIHGKVREKARSILVTSLTSIIGAVPLLLVKGGGFSTNLAFFMFWGIINSTAVVFILFPGVLVYGHSE